MSLNEADTQKRNAIMADMGLIFVALIWGGGFVAGKFALTGMGPLNVTAYRYTVAAVAMFFISIRKLQHITEKMVLRAGGIGFLIFAGNTLQTVGLQYTTPGKQSFIISLYTILVPLISRVMFKTKPSRRILAAAVLALAGIALLTLKDDFSIGIGDFLTFLFAVTFSMQVILIERFIKDADAALFTFLQIAATALFSIVTLLLFEPVQSMFDLSIVPACALLYLALFNSTCAFLLQNLCQRFAPASHTAILMSLETVFGTIFAITLAGEVFQGRMIVGCVFMFAAIATAELPVKGLKK